MTHNFKPNDIVECSWGYDQTNVDFYKVLKATPSTVKLIKVASTEISDGPQTMTGKVTPNPLQEIGEPFRRKVSEYYEGAMIIIDRSPFRSALLWNGTPQRVSHYA